MKIEFLTDDEVAAKFFAIEPMKKHIPDWYKALPLQMDIDKFATGTNRNIKSCMPVRDYLTSGYLIKVTDEMLLKNVKEPNEGIDTYTFIHKTTRTGTVGGHGHVQCPIKIQNRRLCYFKIISPWIIKTPVGYSCLFYQPFYNNIDQKFTIMPGIVDTDSHDLPINFSGFLHGEEEVHITPGDPLVCVFPFKRESWQMEVRVEQPKQSAFRNYFVEGYKKLSWKKKSYT